MMKIMNNDLMSQITHYKKIYDHLNDIINTMNTDFEAANRSVLDEFKNYHTIYVKKIHEQLNDMNLLMQDLEKYHDNMQLHDKIFFDKPNMKTPEVSSVVRETAGREQWQVTYFDVPMSWKSILDAQDLGEQNLIGVGSKASYIETLEGNQDGWVPPTREVIAYYMDPRNFVDDEEKMFQFLDLSYNPDESIDAINEFLSSTAYKGYGDKIMEASKANDVSAYYVSAKLVGEAGTNGNALTTGTVPGYENYFNPFNHGAGGKTDREVHINGALFAKKRGWTTFDAGLKGGIKEFCKNYIHKGQNTVYFQKFDVIADDGYFHQYMQNVEVSKLEGTELYNLYKDNGLLDNNLRFKIPRYEDLPEEVSKLPE